MVDVGFHSVQPNLHTLNNANLSNAHLLGANLSHTDFSDATVDNARFGWNTGISNRMKFELQLRGAIFED